MRMMAMALLALIMSGPAQAQDAPAVDEASPSTETTAEQAVAPSPSVGVPEAIRGHIAEVRFTGLRRVEEAAMLAAVGMRAGELVSMGKVQRDLIAVYETGFIEDVNVDVSPAPESLYTGSPR